jgi:hypothetical protein
MTLIDEAKAMRRACHSRHTRSVELVLRKLGAGKSTEDILADHRG